MSDSLPDRATWATLNLFERIRLTVACVPHGRVATYGQIAVIACGTVRGARTVGWALHGLTEGQARVIPWWRIINAQGRISTSCREHSAARQRLLLEAEGVEFDASDRIPLDVYGWEVTSEVELFNMHAGSAPPAAGAGRERARE